MEEPIDVDEGEKLALEDAQVSTIENCIMNAQSNYANGDAEQADQWLKAAPGKLRERRKELAPRLADYEAQRRT